MEDLKKSYERIDLSKHTQSICKDKRENHTYKIMYEDKIRIDIKCTKCGLENVIIRN